jgi:hypothetical protein
VVYHLREHTVILHFSPTECIYGFNTSFTVNSDYFLEQRQPVDLCKESRYDLFKVGTGLFKCCLHELVRHGEKYIFVSIHGVVVHHSLLYVILARLTNDI